VTRKKKKVKEPSMRARRIGALALAAVTVMGAGACGIARAEEPSVARKDRLVIGVNTDQPGLALKTGKGDNGGYEGFDVDVAREIARRLGATSVAFEPVTSATRPDKIRDGSVDLVVASYSITPERKTKVAFAGPYYVSHQDTLVRADESGVKSIRNLTGKRLCAVNGSVSWERVVKQRGVAAQPVPAGGYKECLDKLTSRALDAVSTDDLILAGLAREAASSGGPKLRILNAPISDEGYGVGLKLGDTDGCEAVNKAITGMYLDGAAQRLLAKWFGPVGLAYTTTVPQFEGCD
jgi:ABC-type amino acid transport substrate-binding protein